MLMVHWHYKSLIVMNSTKLTIHHNFLSLQCFSYETIINTLVFYPTKFHISFIYQSFLHYIFTIQYLNATITYSISSRLQLPSRNSCKTLQKLQEKVLFSCILDFARSLQVLQEKSPFLAMLARSCNSCKSCKMFLQNGFYWVCRVCSHLTLKCVV